MNVNLPEQHCTLWSTNRRRRWWWWWSSFINRTRNAVQQCSICRQNRSKQMFWRTERLNELAFTTAR